jgi:hypothetical protein
MAEADRATLAGLDASSLQRPSPALGPGIAGHWPLLAITGL